MNARPVYDLSDMLDDYAELCRLHAIDIDASFEAAEPTLPDATLTPEEIVELNERLMGNWIEREGL